MLLNQSIIIDHERRKNNNVLMTSNLLLMMRHIVRECSGTGEISIMWTEYCTRFLWCCFLASDSSCFRCLIQSRPVQDWFRGVCVTVQTVPSSSAATLRLIILSSAAVFLLLLFLPPLFISWLDWFCAGDLAFAPLMDVWHWLLDPAQITFMTSVSF